MALVNAIGRSYGHTHFVYLDWLRCSKMQIDVPQKTNTRCVILGY